jgi:hypothetical protein
MGPPLPYNLKEPAERDAKTINDIAARWGSSAVDELYALLPRGTRWLRFVSLGRLAWVHADTPTVGSAVFARVGDTFEAFPTPRFSGAEPEAFAAILADGQLDVVADKDEVIRAFVAVTGATPVLTQKEADALLVSPHGPDNGADPKAVALFEPPHFRGRTLAFVATFAFAASLIRVLVDADTLAVRTERLGRSQRQFMPVG